MTFPLTAAEATVYEGTHGSLDDQMVQIVPWLDAMINMARASQSQNPSIGQMQAAALVLQENNPSRLLAGHEVWYDLRLKPVAGNSFSGAYNVGVTALQVPMTINFSAPSSP